jgi:hypothetical protein
MLRKIAKDMGIEIGEAEKRYDERYPFIMFSDNAIAQCTESHNGTKPLPLPEFINLLKGYKKPVTTKFGGHDVTLTDKVLKVGCNTFTVIEVKTFIEFLNKNLK